VSTATIQLFPERDPIVALLGREPAKLADEIDRLVDSLQRLRLSLGSAGGQASIGMVLGIVCRSFGVGEAALLGRSRQEQIAWPRHVAAWCLVQVIGLSLNAVGRAMDRDHGSIHNSKEQVWARMDVDPLFRAQVERIRDEIKANLARARK